MLQKRTLKIGCVHKRVLKQYKHDIRIKWVRNLEYVVQAIQVLENLVLPRLTGGLQKLDFPPFPVFF